jgi:hypothetical protein
MDNHISAYRLFDDYGSHPWRCRVNGAPLLTKKGTTKKFSTMDQAIKAGQAELNKLKGVLI